MADFKLLIVDDEPSIRCARYRALGDRERRIATAGDGPYALAVPEHHPSRTSVVAIDDLRMPRINGVELRTEESRRGPPTEVLHLAGDSTLSKPALKRVETAG